MRRTNLHAELLNGYFESRLVVILIHCVEEFHDIKFPGNLGKGFFAYSVRPSTVQSKSDFLGKIWDIKLWVLHLI